MFRIHMIVVLVLALLGLSARSVFAQAVSNQAAPDFTLTDTNGLKHSLSDYKGKFVVLEWFNPDCPFVKKHYN